MTDEATGAVPKPLYKYVDIAGRKRILQGSIRVTVNALGPGGSTKTGMVPPAYHSEPNLLDPDIIVPPLLWLASERSDGITGMRFVATKWQTDLEESAAAEGAREIAGWPGDPVPAR